jgi:hypothetical protein
LLSLAGTAGGLAAVGSALLGDWCVDMKILLGNAGVAVILVLFSECEEFFSN